MKRAQKPVTFQEQRDTITVDSFAVDDVRDTQFGVFFNLTLNGVKIYGCKIVEGKEGKYPDFVSFPSRGYTDRDGNKRYASIVWAGLSDADTEKIVKACEDALGV